MPPTVGVSISLTLNVGDREFFRPEVRIDDIDCAGDIEGQLELVHRGIEAVFNGAAEHLIAKVAEFTKGGLKTKGG